MSHGKTKCRVCKKMFQKRCYNHKVCDTCHPGYKRMDNIKRLKGYREKRGARAVGSIFKCSTCGEDTVFRAANQHRCKDCQQKYNVSQIRKWLSANVARTGEYKRTAKENYYYSGNRIPAHERDGYKCVRCASPDNLHVHHIDGKGKGTPKNERNDSLDNLVTLCNKCHSMLHAFTEKQLFDLHYETVYSVFKEFVYSHCAPQA